ncbi:predicted protein [Verticillium alfalfae VaMs.102]|uniref:Predicted protein n=1 Tax=Verticillium alfalfae (strain VaMs.102 / ATCC MYA-4576 / FGSC 10136) TaxID=526221 RepID=C9SDZ7_VERA1|nr:predicted protein [Verticillium alfalfae VaMs.102]EEY17244.1 predicted protein [Verticillium alfalfae VaMs.102]
MSRPRNWTFRGGGHRPVDATAIPGKLGQENPGYLRPPSPLAYGAKWCRRSETAKRLAVVPIQEHHGGSFWGLGVPDRGRSCRSMPLAVVFDLSWVFRRDRS